MIFPNVNPIRSPSPFLPAKQPHLPMLWGKGGTPQHPWPQVWLAEWQSNPETKMDQAGLGVAAQPSVLAVPWGDFPLLGQTENWLSLARTDPPPVQTSSDHRQEWELAARQRKPSWAEARDCLC